MILTGKTTIVELHSDLEGDWQRGIRRVRRFRGLRDDLEGMVPFVHAPGVQWSIEDDEPPFARLTIRFGDSDDGSDPDESATTLWTLDGNDLEKDILSHPSITLAEAGDIRDKLAIAEENNHDYSSFLGSFTNPAAEDIYILKAKGVDSYLLSQFVLRRSTKVPAAYSSKWPTTNVGRQYTTAELEAAEVVPPTLIFNMPAGAWLKKSPQITMNHDGSWQIDNEWWHADSWSLRLYPKAT